jgi:hypothetical protein
MRALLLALLLLALRPGPAAAADFQDEVSRPRQAPPRLARADLPQGRKGAAPLDSTWALPPGDAELRAAIRSAQAAEAARHHPAGGALPAAALQPVLLELLNPQHAELSAREREAFAAAVAQWAARQGLGGEGVGEGGQGQELSASLLQQQAALKFLRSTAAALAKIRGEERLRQKAQNILEQTQEAALEAARGEAL